MPTFNRALAVALTAITLLGCSSLQPLSESQPAAPGAAAAPLPTMEVGQDLRLTLASGAQIDLQVLAVKADAIEGVQSGPVSYTHLDVYKRQAWSPP